MKTTEIAAMLEAKGLTSADKHDCVLAILGQRVRVAELREDKNGQVSVLSGETTLDMAKKMLEELPDNHNLGIYNVCLGKDYDCDEFLAFVSHVAKAKNFSLVLTHGHRSSKAVFDDLLKVVSSNAKPQ
jgi:hypothetical protein